MGAFAAAPREPWTTTKETLRHSSAQMESGVQARIPAASRARAAARLRLFWRAEQEICRPDPSSLARAEAAFFARQAGQVRLFVADYHGERAAKAGQIAAILRSPPTNISQI